jgi:hypothetical protein
LRRNADASDAGVDAVRQREIDASKAAAKRQRRFASLPGQSAEPATLTAGKDDGKGGTGHCASRHGDLLKRT